MYQVYLLTSDNFGSELVTPRALKLIQLNMSTGDYSTHQAVKIDVDSLADVWDVRLDGGFIRYPKD